MSSFYSITQSADPRGRITVKPIFDTTNRSDIVVVHGELEAAWIGTDRWETEHDIILKKIDQDIYDIRDRIIEASPETKVIMHTMSNYDCGSYSKFTRYLKEIPQTTIRLDMIPHYANSKHTRNELASIYLEYSPEPGDHSAWDELASTLYEDTEREKLEWLIGAIATGESRKVGKMFSLYGPPGSGKGTIISVIDGLFPGYIGRVDVRSLGDRNNQFGMSVFSDNKLVMIDDDADMSQIHVLDILNKIIVGEQFILNAKYARAYSTAVTSMIIIATNEAIRVQSANDGIIRRLVDIQPRNTRIPMAQYNNLMAGIFANKGALVDHCISVFYKLGSQHYRDYVPTRVLERGGAFFGFINECLPRWAVEGSIPRAAIYSEYRQWMNDHGYTNIWNSGELAKSLEQYATYHEHIKIGDTQYHRLYTDFRVDRLSAPQADVPEEHPWPHLVEQPSIFDDLLSDAAAQYANDQETPKQAWANVTTILSDIDTSKVHYVMVPENHIVIDLDIVDRHGQKDMTANLNAARSLNLPETYSEVSKSGGGLHLHYWYDGDLEKIGVPIRDGIEVKVYRGNSSLRRRLTLCDNTSVAHISDGLPLKENKMFDKTQLTNEARMRAQIIKAMNEKVGGGTKTTCDFIAHILNEALQQGVAYDLTDMKSKALKFAGGSSHQTLLAMTTITKAPWKSEVEGIFVEPNNELPVVVFDLEVYSNLFVCCYQQIDLDTYQPIGDMVKLTNPSRNDIQQLIDNNRVVGFNNRKYDNHILYGALLGFTNEELYKLSSRIISGVKDAMFREAYNLSYTDIYDVSRTIDGGKSLKKWEVELGIEHVEMDIPWDEPAPEADWDRIVEYCSNDVLATISVWKAIDSAWTARKILADISGLSVNDLTNSHTRNIIFGTERHPQPEFPKVDLSETFPGYIYDPFKGPRYKDEDPGRGGYVDVRPGYYENVALLDVASMHPNSIVQLNLFGRYTKNFKELMDARLALKHRDWTALRYILNGKVYQHVNQEGDNTALSNALKVSINSVYGQTAATYENPFADPRNVDNCVAMRGALFMIDLKHALDDKGIMWIHFKTDSVKIANATEADIRFVMEFGQKYGYTFEHEATYDKLCIVNASTYICHNEKGWSATAAQFQQPYVFKTLFSKEPLVSTDLSVVKEVQGNIFIDRGEGNREHIGRVGRFVPITSGHGGGDLIRVGNDKKESSVSGTKGYIWTTFEHVMAADLMDHVDMSYFDKELDKAREAINQYTNADTFCN